MLRLCGRFVGTLRLAQWLIHNGDMYYIRQTFIVNLFFERAIKNLHALLITWISKEDYSDFRDFQGFSEISMKLIESSPRVC